SMNIHTERTPLFAEEIKVKPKGEQLTRDQMLLRIGAVCAILGAVISVAAGIGFGNLTNDSVIESVLSYLSASPRWYWPLVHLGFIFGAVLWVEAFTALSSSFKSDASWVLGRLAVMSILVGAALHIVDSCINGFGLAALTEVWMNAPTSDQPSIVAN